MADTTSAKGHKEAATAVAGGADPEEVYTTRDLKSEQDKTEKLVSEAEEALGVVDGVTPFTHALEGEEREQRFVRTLPNGKTEAILERPDEFPVFPPDDGGYNPERRFYAGPDDTMTPQAADAHRRSEAVVFENDEPPAGWKEENRV